MNERELYHYGVKGMKWGVRRAAKKEAINKYREEYRTANSGTSKFSQKINRAMGADKVYAYNKYIANDKPMKTSGVGSAQSVKRHAAAAANVAYMDTTTAARVKAASDRALKKLEKQKVSDLKKKYGQLEDQRTYGKDADAKKNARIDKEMAAIEEELRRKR